MEEQVQPSQPQQTNTPPEGMVYVVPPSSVPHDPRIGKGGPKEYTGYPHHKPGGRGFAKGHKKLGGIKKGFKHFRTLFQEEMERTVLDPSTGRTVRTDIAIARKTSDLAREGNLTATQLIIERMDGKVPQVLSGDMDNPLTIIIEADIASKYMPGK